ncbi:hypothetical protein S83_010815 [Arachis hypogaea]
MYQAWLYWSETMHQRWSSTMGSFNFFVLMEVSCNYLLTLEKYVSICIRFGINYLDLFILCFRCGVLCRFLDFLEDIQRIHLEREKMAMYHLPFLVPTELHQQI